MSHLKSRVFELETLIFPINFANPFQLQHGNSIKILLYLNVSWSLDVLAVVAPVSGAAEPFCAQLSLKYSSHLNTILGLQVGKY